VEPKRTNTPKSPGKSENPQEPSPEPTREELRTDYLEFGALAGHASSQKREFELMSGAEPTPLERTEGLEDHIFRLMADDIDEFEGAMPAEAFRADLESAWKVLRGSGPGFFGKPDSLSDEDWLRINDPQTPDDLARQLFIERGLEYYPPRARLAWEETTARRAEDDDE